MAKQANSSTIKKLQDEVVKLKSQLATKDSKLKASEKIQKEQKNNFKDELAKKIGIATSEALSQARVLAEKKIAARDKVVADTVTKFEKQWAKKNKSTVKPVKSQKLVKLPKNQKEQKTLKISKDLKELKDLKGSKGKAVKKTYNTKKSREAVIQPPVEETSLPE